MDLISDIFIAGLQHFGSYRIPYIIMGRHDILIAFSEARKELNDHAETKTYCEGASMVGIPEHGGPMQIKILSRTSMKQQQKPGTKGKEYAKHG